MVWIELPDAQLLSISPALWESFRDGRPLSDIYRPAFGFRVLQQFTLPDRKTTFLPGMQGQVVAYKDSSVFVEARDLFNDKKKFLRTWIPRSVIKIGTELYGTWKIDISQIPRESSRLTSQELKLLEDPECSHLALGISAFLTTLAKTDPDCLTPADLEKLGGNTGSKVPWITTQIIKGIEKAGLKRVLNNPQFTVDELVTGSSLDCNSNDARGKPGFYLRRYSVLDRDTNKRECSLYVGQSWDLKARCEFWAGHPAGHADVAEKSFSIDMKAICLVPDVFYQEHKYIVEQLLTSLLQTYKDTLLAQKSVNTQDIQNIFGAKNCLDMTAIATAAAKESGWPGAVQRTAFWNQSFHKCDGLNIKSPIVEAAQNEQHFWLRTDGYMPADESHQMPADRPGQPIPISNFTRAVPKQMTVIPPSGASKKPSFIMFRIEDRDVYSMRIARTLPQDGLKDGINWPAQNSFFDVTFEVRTDWKPHPYSWACLPLVGPFEDWDRANSWAVFISWTDPSGQYRQKYLHCEMPHTMVDKNSHGSIQSYARGIEIIHWLFREKISEKNQQSWLQTPPMALVKVVKHDYVSQKITIESPGPVTSTAPISSKRKHPDTIKNEMEGLGIHGDFGLQHVGLSKEEAVVVTTVKFGTRQKCDSCMFFHRGSNITICKKTPNGKACNNCLNIFGRPFCSYTPNIPAAFQAGTKMLGNSYAELASRNDSENALRRQALHGLEGWTGDAQLSADPAVLEVETEAVEEIDDDILKAALEKEIKFGREWLG